MGLLFALSLPGVVCLLVALAAVERMGRRGRAAPLAASGLEDLHAALSGAKRTEVEERAARSVLPDEDQEGAPPRVDLDRRTVRIRRG